MSQSMSKASVYAKWSTQDKDFVIEQLIQAKKDGHMTQGGFRGFVWTNIAASFDDDTKNPRSTQTMYGRMKTEYLDIKRLRERPEFAWDYLKNTVTTSQNVWAELRKKDFKLARLEGKSFLWFEKIAEIEGESITTDKYISYGPVNSKVLIFPNAHEVEEDRKNDIDFTGHRSVTSGGYEVESDMEVSFTVKKGSKSEILSDDTPATSQRTVKSRTTNFEVLNEIRVYIKAMAEAYTKKHLSQEASGTTITNVAFDLVLNDPLLTSEGQALMLDIVADELKASAYVKIKDKIIVRRLWLIRQIEYAQGNISKCVKE